MKNPLSPCLTLSLHNSTIRSIAFFFILFIANSTAFAQPSCLTYGDVYVQSTSMDSPKDGPFQMGEIVEVCFFIDYSPTANGAFNCNWLHGMVPTFGSGWDPVSFSPEGEPLNFTTNFFEEYQQSTWDWYPEGEVYYNNIPFSTYAPGAVMKSGWFATRGITPPGNASCPQGAFLEDPNCACGIVTNCASPLFYTACFNLQVKSECEPGVPLDCTVGFEVFADAETGGNPTFGCINAEPVFGYYTANCCEAPMMLPAAFDYCNSTSLDINLEDYLLNPTADTEITYTWTTNNPQNISGQSNCTDNCNPLLTDQLINTSNVPQSIIYSVTPVADDGCQGSSFDFSITVMPELEAEIITIEALELCKGDCAVLEAIVSGGSGIYNYSWPMPSQEVCPEVNTTYAITITDDLGCSVITEITLDVLNLPDVSLVTELTAVCQGAALDILSAEPAGGNWGGPVNINGEFLPDEIGTHSVTYTVDDLITGCQNTAEVFVEVEEKMLEMPVYADSFASAYCVETDYLFCVHGTMDAESYEWKITNGQVKELQEDGRCAIITWTNIGQAAAICVNSRTNNCVSEINCSADFIILEPAGCISGVEDLGKNALTIYPNPAIAHLVVDGSMALERIQVFNTLGQSIFEKSNISSNKYTIDLIGWEAGIYFLQLPKYELKKIVVE